MQLLELTLLFIALLQYSTADDRLFVRRSIHWPIMEMGLDDVRLP